MVVRWTFVHDLAIHHLSPLSILGSAHFMTLDERKQLTMILIFPSPLWREAWTCDPGSANHIHPPWKPPCLFPFLFFLVNLLDLFMSFLPTSFISIRDLDKSRQLPFAKSSKGLCAVVCLHTTRKGGKD